MPFVPSPQKPPPPRIRQLSDHLRSEVERYRQEHPGLSDQEVRLAVRHLASRLGTRGTLRTVALLAGGLAALAGTGAALILSGSREAAALWETLGPHGVLGIVVAVMAVVVLLNRSLR